MFTHLVTLKKSPYFVYATDQEDAITICKKYKDNVVGVAFAPQGLIMQEVHQEITLKNPEVRLIDQIVDLENVRIAKAAMEECDEENNKLVQKAIQE